MAVTHSSSIRNSIANLILSAIDAGSGAGKLVLKAGSTTIATIPFADPFGTVIGAVLTLDIDPIPEANAIAAGMITGFEAQDSTGALVMSGTVTATGGGGDITIGSPTVAIGDPIKLTSFVYTAPL